MATNAYSSIMSPIVDNILDNVKNLPADAATEIMETVHAVMHLYRARQYKALRAGAHEIAHMEVRVLNYFNRFPGATQSDLAKRTARDRAQLARLISTLREKRLLETRVDEVDRRIQRHFVTKEGRHLHATLERQRVRVAKLGVTGLADDEARLLAQLLLRIRSNLETSGED